MRAARSRFGGFLHVGADYFARRGALVSRDPAPRGVVDRVADLANPGVDVARIHPAVARFFEDTASLDLLVRSHWRFPFSWVWPIARHAMRLIGQFVLPRREGRIVTRAMAIDPSLDGRADARAVIRAYAGSGEVMQAVAYATWQRGESRYMSAVFPMPGGNVAGILRLEPLGADAEDRTGAALTSRQRDGDDAGVWLVVGPVAIPWVFGERLELWAPGMTGVPDGVDPGAFPGATLLGRHEQRIFGVVFVVHHYWFR